MDAALQELVDRQAIIQQIYTYCRAVDRLDIPLGHAVFHEDSHADYGAGYYQGPGRGVIDLICGHHGPLISHSHQVGNVLIELDGDRAASEAYCTGTMRLMREGQLMQMTAWVRYCDSWSRRGGHWAIDRRVVVFDHDEIHAVTAIGLASNASRDRDDPSYALLGNRL